MDDTLAPVTDGPAPAEGALPAGRPPSFMRRAATVFLALALFALFAFLVVFVAGRGLPPLEFGILLATTLVTGCAALWLSLDLDRGRASAPAAAVAVLVVVIGAALVRVVMGLGTGHLEVPLDAILAGWALAARDRPAVSRRDVPLRGWGIVAALVVVNAAPPLVATARQLTALEPADLSLRISASCDPSPATGEPLLVRVTWSWRGGELFGPQQDAIEVSWGAVAPLALRRDVLAWPAGFEEDQPGPAMDLLAGPSLVAGIPSVRVGFPSGSGDGRLEVPFAVLAGERTVTDIVATFAHGDRWQTVAYTPCELPGPSAPVTAP